ncbi:hypothetical protein AACH06_07050 [Ideonella sp. DXS29W]|uniref:Uncharacterized protein n=1 Tax=Ideonella lacteola TaxID=2984193 RepID=A0ABU9BKU5_9BURK
MRAMYFWLAASLFSTSAMAAGYSEKKSGDLSNSGATPTAVKLKLGNNVISGKYGTKSGTTDRDYFTIKIPAGQQLSAIILEPETQVGINVSFIGIQKGKQVTVPPVGGSPEDLLGYALYGTSDEGKDILPAIGQGSGSKGFVPPLGAGTYSFWVQETATCDCQYKFTFVMSAATGE